MFPSSFARFTCSHYFSYNSLLYPTEICAKHRQFKSNQLTHVLVSPLGYRTNTVQIPYGTVEIPNLYLINTYKNQINKKERMFGQTFSFPVKSKGIQCSESFAKNPSTFFNRPRTLCSHHAKGTALAPLQT